MTMTAPNFERSLVDDAFEVDAQDESRSEYRGGSTNLPALVTAPPSRRWAAALFICAAVAWTAAAIWGAMIAVTGRQLNAAVAVSWLSAAATPLTLIAVVYLLWRRSPTRERERLARATGELRAEGRTLEELIERLTLRADGHRAAIAENVEQIGRIGSTTGTHLQAIGESLRQGTATLSRHADQLDSAADSTRTDIGVLIEDLPRARAQVEQLAMAIGTAGDVAMGRIETLYAGLMNLQNAAGAAGELVSGTASALAGQVERISSQAEAASSRIESTTARLDERVTLACGAAEAGMESVRGGVDAQAGALSALVEQTRAALDLIGREVTSTLAQRVADVSAGIDGLGDRLSLHDGSARALFVELTRQLAEVEARQVALTEAGIARSKALGGSIADVSARLEQLTQLVGASDLASGAAIARTTDFELRLERLAEALGDGMPVLIDTVESRLAGLNDRANAIGPRLTALAQTAEQAGAQVAEASGDGERALSAANELVASIEHHLAALSARVAALRVDIGGLETESTVLAGGSASRLVDALTRASETGRQAAERAREAIGTVIPQAAARLSEEASAALGQAVASAFDERSSALIESSERSTAAAEAAAATIGERIAELDAMLAATEARVESNKAAVDQSGDGAFSRRLTLMIEALNSTAIDVTKILSNEVTDTAWAAYLKGDRGVFARRAVRLLDTGEAREIVRHYEGDGEFHAQVDRYIHDFEAMLRDVLAFRSSTPMGVTLLSSDVGKLYVALAQAIERLRT